MHSYADVIEMKRANVRNYAIVRRYYDRNYAIVRQCMAVFTEVKKKFESLKLT